MLNRRCACYTSYFFPFSSLYFSGAAWFRRLVDLSYRLRLLAEAKGFRLDDTGLFPATHGSGGKRV